MGAQWYVLRSKPRKEEILWRQAVIRLFDVFYPRLQTSPVNPRSRKHRSYFPGYMFVKADLEEVGLSAFNYMPYAVGLVCFGDVPASVPDEIIMALRRRVSEVAHAGRGQSDGLKQGERVEILDGPLAGYEALFDVGLPKTDRVRVLLKMLSDRYVPVELKAATVAKTVDPPPMVGLQYAAQ